MVSHYWSIENQSKFTNESRNAMVLPYDFWSYSEVIRGDRAPFLIYPKTKILKNILKCSRIDPIYSWNRQLAHTPFPKKINTPTTTVRFIRFVAKISVLSPKLPANGQWAKKTKEWVTFFICSPLIDRTNKEESFWSLTSLALFLSVFLMQFF